MINVTESFSVNLEAFNSRFWRSKKNTYKSILNILNIWSKSMTRSIKEQSSQVVNPSIYYILSTKLFLRNTQVTFCLLN